MNERSHTLRKLTEKKMKQIYLNNAIDLVFFCFFLFLFVFQLVAFRFWFVHEMIPSFYLAVLNGVACISLMLHHILNIIDL